MPANASRSDVLIASGCAGIVSVKPMSSVNCSKVRPASWAVRWKRTAANSSVASSSSVRDRDEGEEVVERELLGGGDVFDRGLLVVVASEVDVPGRPRRRLRSRSSSASAPLSTQRSGATATRRRRKSSKATCLRRRASGSPVRAASLFSRSSRACRNAAAVAYLIDPRWRRARLRRRASCRGGLLPATSWRSVRRPRRSACRTAIAACSGWSSSTTSTSVRAGAVSGSPSRHTVGTSLVVGAGVEHDPGRAAEAAVAARHEQMHRVGDRRRSARAAPARSDERGPPSRSRRPSTSRASRRARSVGKPCSR